MNKVCYTCITGSYDEPLPFVKTEGWDYIMYTDNPNLGKEHNGWTIRQVNNPDNLDSTRLARTYKLTPMDLFPKYDLSIWVDGNISIKCNLDSVVKQVPENFDIVSLNHPYRNCVYKEAEECKRQNKDDHQIMDKQMKIYKEKGMPEDYGLVQSGILIRKHNKEIVKEFMRNWLKEVLKHSKRDQLSFHYVKWKMNDPLNHYVMDSSILFNPSFFPIKQHNHGW